MDPSASGSFYEDEVVDEDQNNNDDESSSEAGHDDDDDFNTADGSPTSFPLHNKKKINDHSAKTPATTVYAFCGDSTESLMPRSRTVEMKRRENDWFIVVYRDLKALVEKFELPANASSNGSYSVIDGTSFADSDALQIRLKRDCSLLLNAMKSNQGDQSFTPVAVEMINSVLMPFVLSEELMFGCRSTWNHVITCLKAVVKRMKTPPKGYSPNSLYSDKPIGNNNNNNNNHTSNTEDLPPSSTITADNDEDGTDTQTPTATATATTTSSATTGLAETGLNLEWRPLMSLLQKIVAAATVPGQGQMYGFVLGLFLAMLRCIPSKALTEIWSFVRRHFIGHITSSTAMSILPTRILGRQTGAVDSESIKQQCDTLREMIEWSAAAWKVPHPITTSEEVFQRLASNILLPVGARLIEKNKQAFDDFVVPLRKRVMELIGEHFRVNLAARRTANGDITLTSGWAVNLLGLLLVRDQEIAWDELVRWRRILEPSCSPKSTSTVAIRYLSDLITVVSKYTQKRVTLLRARKPVPTREVIVEVFPALEGDKLQKFLNLTVPLVADTAFNPRIFTTYSYTMWVLNFLDPTPATAARSLASVQVGFSDAGKETKQVTQALKILSEQLCAMSSQTLFMISTSNDENNSVNGKMWKELLPSNYSNSFLGIPSEDAAAGSAGNNNNQQKYILPSHTTAGALQTAAKEIVADAKCPFDCVKKMSSVFFYQALENLESTVEDRVNDAFRCIYSLVIFGQCDHLPAAQRKEIVRAFVSKMEEKYFPVEASLSSTTAGLLHFAFTAVFRLVADDTAETLRVVQQIRDMLSKPSIHETLSTCLRTLFAAILEQGSVFLFSRVTEDLPPISYLNQLQKNTHNENNNNSTTSAATATAIPHHHHPVDPESINDIRKNHPDLLQWYCPLIEQIFDATQLEVANGLTTTSRFVGNVFAVCTLLEHLPAPVLNQLALERTKKFIQYLVSWCQEKANDSEISEKAEADFRCVSSSIQSILDVAVRALMKPLPYDTIQITLGADVWKPNYQIMRFIEPRCADQQAARSWIAELMGEARKQLSLIPLEAENLERALRCEIAGRIIGGVRTGCWDFTGMASEKIQALDAEIAKSSSIKQGKNKKDNNNKVDDDSAVVVADDDTEINEEPSQESGWWLARFYNVERIVDPSLVAPTHGCNPNVARDSTDLDSEIYLWLIQEMLTKYCSVPTTTTTTLLNEKNEDSASPTTPSGNNNNSKKTSPITGVPQGQLFEDHPLFQIDSLVEVDDIPAPMYKTLMALLEGNYTFDYTGLMNEFSAPGDDGGREHFHYRTSASRSTNRSRARAGAFGRTSSPWSSAKESGIMLNLSFCKSVAMRQQTQRALAAFCQEWVDSGTYPHLVDAIVKSVKRRLDMGNPGWLARLSDNHCKAGLYLIVELISVLGRDHIYELAEPLLTELCLGAQLPRPSNERRKEGTIRTLIQKLQSSSFGPPAAVCDRQIGRWLDFAKEPGRPPISVARCLHVALCYFRHTKKLNDQCSVNSVMRHACLSFITEDHLQFLMSLTTQLHRATENAWKLLHNVGLVVSRSMHFIHTHLPREGVHDHEVCPAVAFYSHHCCSNKDENDPWIPLTGKNNHAITDCCPFMSNYLHPTASCAILHRKSYTWGKISGHTAELASSLGQAFFRPEFIRQCLEVHISLLRSEAIAGERGGRRTTTTVQSSPLASAVEWSRFARCALWSRLSEAYNNHEKGMYQGKSLGELEMNVLHQLTVLWTGTINDVLPKFNASGSTSSSPSTTRLQQNAQFGGGATPSLQAVARSPALVSGEARADGLILDELDEGPAVEQQRLAEEAKLAQAAKEKEAHEAEKKKEEGQKVTQDGEGEKKEIPAEKMKKSSSTSSSSDEAESKEQQQQQQKQHVDPESALGGASPATNKNTIQQQQHQTSAICEFLAGNALCKGLFGAIQHLAYPLDQNNETVKQTRKSIVEMVLDLFRQTMFVPAIPHEAASLFLNSWGGFASALSVEEKVEIHKYLFAVVTQSPNIAESSNELVRRRAWHALRRSYGAPGRGLWREALLLEDAFLLDQLLTKEIYDTAVEDSSRSVRAEANATFKTYLESAVVSRIASFYDYTNVPGGFPVDEDLLRSDKLTHRIEATILKMRLDVLHEASASAQKRVRAALSLISLVTAGVALTAVLPEIPDIATTLISVPSEAAYASSLTNLRRAPSDYKSVAEILITLLQSVQSEIQNLRRDASNNNNNNNSTEDSSVAQIMARVSPLIIYLQFLASSRFSNDIGPLPGNVLDITASAFYLPGRQMMQRTSTTLATWIQVVPRADVRDFVIRSIKNLDAAAQARDSVSMKVGIASLVAVVNAFQHTVPAFVPACLMKLVKYKSAITLTRDEVEEQKRQQQESDNQDSATASPTTIATTASGNTATKTEDYKSIATEGLQLWWAVHLEAWEQEHKANFSESQAQAISDACKARSYFV